MHEILIIYRKFFCRYYKFIFIHLFFICILSFIMWLRKREAFNKWRIVEMWREFNFIKKISFHTSYTFFVCFSACCGYENCWKCAVCHISVKIYWFFGYILEQFFVKFWKILHIFQLFLIIFWNFLESLSEFLFCSFQGVFSFLNLKKYTSKSHIKFQINLNKPFLKCALSPTSLWLPYLHSSLHYAFNIGFQWIHEFIYFIFSCLAFIFFFSPNILIICR